MFADMATSVAPPPHPSPPHPPPLPSTHYTFGLSNLSFAISAFRFTCPNRLQRFAFCKKAVEAVLARPLEVGGVPEEDDDAEQEQDYIASYAMQQVNKHIGRRRS